MNKFLILLLFVIGCGVSDNNDTDSSQLQINLILKDAFSQESSSFIQGNNIEFFLSITKLLLKSICFLSYDTNKIALSAAVAASVV